MAVVGQSGAKSTFPRAAIRIDSWIDAAPVTWMGGSLRVTVDLRGVVPPPTGAIEIAGAGGRCSMDLAVQYATCMISVPLPATTLTAHYHGDINYDAADIPLAVMVRRWLDVDLNGASDGLTDGIIILRYLFGLRGVPMSFGYIGYGATAANPRQIATYLQYGVGSRLDVDGNGRPDALTDGLIILRYLLGLRGDVLIAGGLGTGATRTTAAAVEDYLDGLEDPLARNATTLSLSTSPSTYPAVPLHVFATVTGRGGVPEGSVRVTSNIGDCTIALQDGTGHCALSRLLSYEGPELAGAYGGDTRYRPSSATAGVLTYSIGEPINFGCSQTHDEGLNLIWPEAGETRTATSDMTKGRLAIRINVPRTFPPIDPTRLARLRIDTLPGSQAAGRELTITGAGRACDFASGYYVASDFGNGHASMSYDFTVGNPTGYAGAGAEFNLDTTVYWVNIRNANGGVPTCPDGSTCGIRFELTAPE